MQEAPKPGADGGRKAEEGSKAKVARTMETRVPKSANHGAGQGPSSAARPIPGATENSGEGDGGPSAAAPPMSGPPVSALLVLRKGK